MQFNKIPIFYFFNMNHSPNTRLFKNRPSPTHHRLSIAWFSFYCLLLSFSFNQHTYGQACCSGGVPIASNIGLTTGQPKSLQLLLTYDYNNLLDLMSGSELLGDRTRERATHSLLFETGYSFNKRFSISTLISFVRQERRVTNLSTLQKDLVATEGLGDVVLLLKYAPFSHQKMQWTLGAGPKLPTGRTDFRDENNLILPADLQPGTGAWDGIFWSAFNRYHIFKKNLTLTAVATLRLTGSNERFDGLQKYEFGDEFQLFFGFNDRYVVGKLLIDPLLMFRYRWTAPDKAFDSNIPSTGGNWFHLVPGLNIAPNPNFSFRLTGDIPLYRNLEGTQLTTSYKLTAALFYNFQLGISAPPNPSNT